MTRCILASVALAAAAFATPAVATYELPCTPLEECVEIGNPCELVSDCSPEIGKCFYIVDFGKLCI